MSEPATSPAGVAPPRRRAWLPRAVAVAVLVAAVVALLRFGVFGGSGEPTAAERTDAINAEIRQRMTTSLENLPPGQHQGHGVTADGGPSRMICGVRVYGYEPQDAQTVDAVDTVYGFHLCATAQPRMTWDFAPKSVAPLVMNATTEPPTFRMAEATDTTSYQDSLKQLMPERYQPVAREGALEPDDMADLRRRFDAAVLEVPASAPAR